MTLAELRAAREKAGDEVVRLSKESGAEGFEASADWDAGWKKANDTYNTALAAEESEVAKASRAAVADRVAADSKRLNSSGVALLRPDYKSETPSFKIPANARRHNKLSAFKGPDAEEHAYKSGLWAAAALYNHGPSRAAYERQFGPMATTLSTTSNTGAAYFVPDELDTRVIEITEQFGIFRQYADVVSMGSDTWSVPRWNGLMTSYYVAEGAAPTQSEPTWDNVQLVAKNLAAYGKLTRQLNEDALIDLGDKIAMAAGISFATAEDNAGFMGDGTSTYGGITGLFTKIVDSANSASLYTATGETTLATLTMGTFTNVVAKFPNYEGAQPKWFCHKEVWGASMARLQMAAGGLTAADVQAGAKPMFLGYEVVFTNVATRAASVTTGVTGILFADLKLSSKFGDRRGRTFESGLINDDMIKQLMTIFVSERFDINNHSIVDPKTSTNPGPVIGLKLG